MANKRIRELDTMTIGTGGTAASSVFLAVDPNSGTTSKVSLEDAVAGTSALSAGSGGGGGVPSIAHAAPARYHRQPVTINNLFATNTAVFGNIFFAFGGGGNQNPFHTATISKTKGNSSVFVSCESAQIKGKAYTKHSGNPSQGFKDGYFHQQQGSGNHRRVGISLVFYDNGFYVHSQSLFHYQLMYWPG